MKKFTMITYQKQKQILQKDKDGNYYDYVVLQESTPVALSELDKYKENVKMIVDKIHKNSPDVAIYIYEGMSPIPFTDSEYKEYYEEIRKM